MPHPDLDALLQALLPFAQQMLAKHGGFHPFGSSMATDGAIMPIAVASESDETPPSQEMIETLTRTLHREASVGQIRAAGICFDVRVTPPGMTDKTDAICVAVEHETGQAMDVFIPYKKDPFGKIFYGDMFAARRTPQFFSPGEGAA